VPSPKILVFDIETSHNLMLAFDAYNPNPVNNIVEERNILTASWKWLGDDKVYGAAVNAATPRDDRAVLLALAAAIIEADAVVAHYGDKFDMPYVRARMAINNLPPLPRVKQIDTCKIAKGVFKFNSNRLDYLGHVFGLGRKKKIPAETWHYCVDMRLSKRKRKEAIDEMQDYNMEDILLLEKVYGRLIPFVPNLMNWTKAFKDQRDVCPACGGEHIQYRGVAIKQSKRYRRYQCQECGSWGTSNKSEK